MSFLSHLTAAATLAAASVISLSYPASAGLLPTFKVDAKTEIGLDESTRTLVNNLPPAIRQAVLDAIKEALPYLDKSVLLYLSKVQEIVNTTLVNASCEFGGAANDALTAALRDAIGRSDKNYVSDTDDVLKGAVSNFGRGTAPHTYRIAYSHVLARVHHNGCVLKNVGEAMVEVRRVADDTRMRWGVWNRVGDRCPAVAACHVMLREETEATMKAADPRDLQAANAGERFAKAPLPASFDKGWFYSLDGREAAMSELIAIKDAVLIAERLRNSDATSHADEAERLIGMAEGILGQANAALPGAGAIGLAQAAVADQQAIAQHLTTARARSVLTHDRAAKLEGRLQVIVRQSPEIVRLAQAEIARVAEQKARHEAMAAHMWERFQGRNFLMMN